MISNLKRIQVSDKPTHVLFIGGKINNSRKVIELCKKHNSLKCIALMKTGIDFSENDWRELLENDTIENIFLESNPKTEFKNTKIQIYPEADYKQFSCLDQYIHSLRYRRINFDLNGVVIFLKESDSSPNQSDISLLLTTLMVSAFFQDGDDVQHYARIDEEIDCFFLDVMRNFKDQREREIAEKEVEKYGMDTACPREVLYNLWKQNEGNIEFFALTLNEKIYSDFVIKELDDEDNNYYKPSSSWDIKLRLAFFSIFSSEPEFQLRSAVVDDLKKKLVTLI